MFLNLPEAKVNIPISLLPKGVKCWEALQMEVPVPWCIATFNINADGITRTKTLFISNPRWLRVVLSTVKDADMRRIQRMQIDHESSAWLSTDVLEVWSERSTDETERQRLAFRFENGDVIFAHDWGDETEAPELDSNWKQIYRANHIQAT